MKLRMIGTSAECAALAWMLADLAVAGVLAEVDIPSWPYPCRPPSTDVRVYLDVRLPETGGAR